MTKYKAEIVISEDQIGYLFSNCQVKSLVEIDEIPVHVDHGKVTVVETNETFENVNISLEPVEEPEPVSKETSSSRPISRTTGKPKRNCHTPFLNPQGKTLAQVVYERFKNTGRFHIDQAEEYVASLGYRYGSASPSLTTLKRTKLAEEVNGLGETGYNVIISSRTAIDWHWVNKEARRISEEFSKARRDAKTARFNDV